MQLDMDLGKAFSEIEKSEAKSILLQFPEGLKQRIVEIAGKFEERFSGRDIYSIIDPCFGACDIPIGKMKAMNVDLVVHFGHNAVLENRNIIYVPLEYRAKDEEIEKMFGRIYSELQKEKIGNITMAASVQYLDIMNRIAKKLEGNGVNVLLSEGSGRTKEKGQVLGCNYHSIRKIANAEAVVFIGDAMFHALGLVLSTRKKVIFFDASEMKIRYLDKEKELFLRKRFAAIAMAKDSNKFGILLSTKAGQERKGLALELKKEIEHKGKEAFILVSDYLLPEYAIGIDVDCFVNTACPRIAIDDASGWKKPIVNPNELEIALGIKDWENYKMEELE